MEGYSGHLKTTESRVEVLLPRNPSEKLKMKIYNNLFPQQIRAPGLIPFPLALSSEKNQAAKNIAEVRQRTWLLIAIEHPGMEV